MRLLPLLALPLLLMTACVTRPVVVADTELMEAGGFDAKADVDACLEEAKQAVESGRAKEVATNTAEGAVVGGAVGAASGAVLGVGRGAGAGAAGGAAGGFVRSMLRVRDPDPIEKAYTNRCLKKRGYDVLGWR